MIEVSNKVIAERIRELLLTHPVLRDDDLRLIANMWGQEVDTHNLPLADFLRMFAGGAITSPESIRRVRQKLQETFPELRGKRWEERQKRHEEAIRHEIMEGKAIVEIKEEVRRVEARQVELLSGQ